MKTFECVENQFSEKITATLHELSQFLYVSTRTIQRVISHEIPSTVMTLTGVIFP